MTQQPLEGQVCYKAVIEIRLDDGPELADRVWLELTLTPDYVNCTRDPSDFVVIIWTLHYDSRCAQDGSKIRRPCRPSGRPGIGFNERQRVG